jgi:ethanolamine-phosphate cytidylyltransferase
LISEKKEPVRIYVDGGFDLIHSGHYNAIRQAKALGDILVVGVNSDAEILKNKGPTVLTCKERADILRACKWVDEVYEDTEYTVRVETLDRYNCQYYAHGDDPVFDVDGTDMCGLLAKLGRFKMFKRTEGVSTTDIVGKLLLLTKDNLSLGRMRSGSFDKPLLSSEYVKEVRRIEHEEVKKENSMI